MRGERCGVRARFDGGRLLNGCSAPTHRQRPWASGMCVKTGTCGDGSGGMCIWVHVIQYGDGGGGGAAVILACTRVRGNS